MATEFVLQMMRDKSVQEKNTESEPLADTMRELIQNAFFQAKNFTV